jgi:threonylcarbamoyladenosine tRNA methylthiotransferase MtaB
MRKIAFFTLGCKVNQSETEALQAEFREKGYQIVDFSDQASVYIINTCTVTHLADRKSRSMIRRALKTNPEAKVVVMGCYAQTNAAAIAKIKGVKLIVGTKEKGNLVARVEELLSEKIKSFPEVHVADLESKLDFTELKTPTEIERSRAYLKVQDGCNQYCSYCIIPYARGSVRSRSWENTLLEAQRLIKAGFKEIVLVGIHLGVYGQDDAGRNLAALMANLLSLDPNVRWRLGSLEPLEVSEELIDLLSADNFCAHLHLPLQSGADQVLKAMCRPYTVKQYVEVINKIREKVPEIAITTDLMVGFPGETLADFQAGLNLVEELKFSKLHVFKYSPRRGTPAAKFPKQVSAVEKEKRSREMIHLGERLAEEYAAKFLGKKLAVLVEKRLKNNFWEGSSEQYLKVRFNSALELRGQIVPVHLKQVKADLCIGDMMLKGV